MQMFKLLGSSIVLVFFVVLTACTSLAAERECKAPGPKLKVCKPNICLSKTSIPKSARSMLSRDIQVISRLTPIEYSGTLVIPPVDSGISVPSFKVPADRVIRSNCLLRTTGALECGQIVQSESCPKTIWLSDETNGRGYYCDLNCTPSTPDAEGNCECETVPNSCEPVG